MNKAEIQNLIKELIEKMTISVRNIGLNDGSDSLEGNNRGTEIISVEVEQPHYFTLHEGEALAALNHLVRRIVENKNGEEANTKAILVDINGYQKRRIENIHAVAHMMAERARYFKSNIEVDPMSSFERRIVHEFLSNETDLKTESEGEGRSRRVVIKYIGTI